MHAVDRMMKAMVSGRSLDMAMASYAYSRAHGLTVWESLRGAVSLFVDYATRVKL